MHFPSTIASSYGFSRPDTGISCNFMVFLLMDSLRVFSPGWTHDNRTSNGHCGHLSGCASVSWVCASESRCVKNKHI